jgi:O-antigen ligase
MSPFIREHVRRGPSPGIVEVLAPEPAAHRNGRRVHPLEMALVALSGLALCSLPWAFGGVDPASQLIFAAISIGALSIAVLPRRAQTEDSEGRRPTTQMLPRLLRFPVFWAGLALYAYVCVQALNPTFVFRQDGTAWWLDRTSHLAWLPSGMATPFDDMNAWRELIIWGSVWALVCALWTGITRRSSVLALLIAIEINAFALAVFGIVQRSSGSSAIYSLRNVGHPDFLAAFIYRNHAAAYFSLVASVSLGLTIRAFWKGRIRMDPSGPAVIHLLFALTLIVALVLSGAFSVIALFAVSMTIVLSSVAMRYGRSFRGPGNDRPILMAAAGLVLFALGLGLVVGYSGLRDRVETLTGGGGYEAARSRLLADRSGLQMLSDRWATGWGAGSFRYGFTKYQRMEPELARISGVRVHWEHVHDDWLELLIELGLIGAIPVASMIVCWARQALRLLLWRKLAMLPIGAGLLVVALHGFVDFPFQNLAVLATASALLPLLVRWAESESEPASQRA